MATSAHQAQQRDSLLVEVQDHLSSELCKRGLDTEQSVQIAASLVDHLADFFGGQLINFPKDYARKLRKRDEEIYQAFNGSNYCELSKRYGVHERSIRRVIARHRNRIQQTSRTDI